MSAEWPLDAIVDGDGPLPPPWDGDIDINDASIESALLTLQHSDSTLAIKVCRKAFHQAEVRRDKQAAVHALYLAFSSLYNSSKSPQLADKVFAIVRERACDISSPRLSLRIELAHASMLSDGGEHAQAMVIRQRALGIAMAIGDNQLISFILFSLAVSCMDLGEAELALTLLDQQQHLLPAEDVLSVNMRSSRHNVMALAWMEIAFAKRAEGHESAATSALLKARELAQSACATPMSARERLNAHDTLVQILLKSGDVGAARTQARAIEALLEAPIEAQSDLWCVLQMTTARIALHDGSASMDTLNALRAIERVQQLDQAVGLYESEVQHALFKAYEILGNHEQALQHHTQWLRSYERRHGAQSRQRIKMLRHTVFAMRAEAVEFIAHDLRTPLAAAQTWMQTLPDEGLPRDALPLVRNAQRQLHNALTLSDLYLGVLRAELMPRNELKPTGLGTLADDICENLSPPKASGIRLARDIDIGVHVVGDPSLLTRALTALLTDAFERAPKDTQVGLQLVTVRDNDDAVLSISHCGNGPSPAVCSRVCQRFADGATVGAADFGLALAARVAQLHRARLRFQTAAGTQSSVRLLFKLADGSQARTDL